MRNNLFSLILLLLCVSILNSCAYKTETNVTVELMNAGTIVVPGENTTVVYNPDNTVSIFFNEELMMIGYSEVLEGRMKDSQHDSIELKEYVSSSVFSNNMIYGKAVFEVDGEEIERYYLSTTNLIGDELHEYIIIVWSNSMDSKAVEDIAKSFIHC